jgi:signal peptidase I
MLTKLSRISQDNNRLDFFEVNGFSMWPFLRQQDKCIVKKVPFESLKIGDIVLYKANGVVVCHRLIGTNKDENNRWVFYIRGDNSFKPEMVTEDMFLGKVIGILKGKRTVNLTTHSKKFKNRMIVIIAPVIAQIIRFLKPLYSLFKSGRDGKRD